MELSKHYNPAPTEGKWYAYWLAKRYFNSVPDEKKLPFTVVIPPPNVTGVLHMGHTLNETVQDILVRRARMQGFNACWVPGSDHASIATEARVVSMLKEKGIDKSSLRREEYLQYAFNWREKYGGIIYDQIARLGCSVDWDRVSFTMDPDYYQAVIKIFNDLYKKGLIYRGARMIHWDPAARTALSDEEVEYKEIQGKLYYVNYLLAEEGQEQTSAGTNRPAGARYITIATQRPETIMGDTAICVNPADPRYRALQGQFAIVPLVNRKVPIIFDDYVDQEFGTGALKVTPAHDINDYNLGLKHKLAVVDTLDEDGRLNSAATVFVGMDRFEARKKVVEALRESGLLVREEDHTTRLGFSQRTNAVVEPKISTQWFVKMKELAGPALRAVKEGSIHIYPEEKFLATYTYWLENVKDWCISRQLWWGQRIPAWYDDRGNFVVAENEQEASRLYASAYAAAPTPLRQDDDVLDTWFSSWLWPIEVFKGITRPGNPDILYYYPGSVLVTGQDIIFFWVARMIMAGMEYMHEKPFGDVYFTGMVRDKQGRKMSKSLGNSPDLLELIDKYGADAVRFGIMISSPAGNDLLFDEASLEQGRNFNNKLWNALKLVRSWKARIPDSDSPASAGPPETSDFPLRWFENRLNEAKAETSLLLKEYKLSEALKITYSLIWDDFCSWYLEWIKPELQASIAKAVYDHTIYFFEELVQMLHPFMPFVTEEIYHLLNERRDGDDLCIKQFAKIGDVDKGVLAQGALLKSLITEIRNLKARVGLTAFAVYLTDKQYVELFPIIRKNTRAMDVLYTPGPVEAALSIVIGENKIFIKSEKPVDSHSQKEELLKELEYHRGFLLSVNKKLSNRQFTQHAKPDVVALEQKKKTDTEARIRVLEESLQGMS